MESAKIENAVVFENYPRMDRWIKKRIKKKKKERGKKRELIWKPRRAGNNRHPQDRAGCSRSLSGFNSNSSGFERCSTELLRISMRAIRVDLNFETTIVYFNAAEFSVHVTNRFFFLSFSFSLWNSFFFSFSRERSLTFDQRTASWEERKEIWKE